MPRDITAAWPVIATLDPITRQKLIDLPGIIDDWVAPHGGLAGMRVLDFGCGFGEMAAGLALAFDPAVVLGIDISRGPVKGREKLVALLGEEGLPANLRLEQVEPGQLGSLAEIDIVVSWSAIEHVARQSLVQILADLHARLVPGGLMMIQISPLYFSPEGAHLWPCGYGAWEHLEKTAAEVLADIDRCEALNPKQRASVSEMFLELNRLTAPELVALVEGAGFEIMRQQVDRCAVVPPEHLRQAYTAEALTTEQVVVLLRKPT